MSPGPAQLAELPAPTQGPKPLPVIAYTEAVDLNHHLRVLETALPRVKSPDAVVVIK